VVVLAVLLAYGLMALLGALVRRKEPEDGPTLADKADAILRARRGIGKFDASFDRMADGTQLGLTSDSAIGWILLGGALSATAVYVATMNELIAGLAALLGGLLVFMVFHTMRNRRRKASRPSFRTAASSSRGRCGPG